MKVSYSNRLRQKKCAWDHIRVEALAEAQSVAWDSVPLGREFELSNSSSHSLSFLFSILFTTPIPSFPAHARRATGNNERCCPHHLCVNSSPSTRKLSRRRCHHRS